MPASKSIILTGASKGLGLAIAKRLLRDSHKLVLVARSAEPLEKLKQEYPGQVEYVAGDLGDFSVRASPSYFSFNSCQELLLERRLYGLR